MHDHVTRRPAAALVMDARALHALIEVEAARDELSPEFSARFAAAVEAAQASLEQTIRDGLDLQDFAADPDVAWLGEQMPPSEAPLDGTWF